MHLQSICRILQSVQDEVDLEEAHPDIVIQLPQKEPEGTVPKPFPTHLLKESSIGESKLKRTQSTTQKKIQKKKRDSDEESDSDSDEMLKDFEVQPGDDEFKKREKEYMKKMYLEEKEQKQKAYQEWKRKNFM